jgi:hypothetical protein
MICAFHALCNVSLVVVHLDLNLNSKFKSNRICNFTFLSLSLFLSRAGPSPFSLPSSSFPSPHGPAHGLFFSLPPLPHAAHQPALSPPAARTPPFPSLPLPFSFLGQPRAPGPICPCPAPSSLSPADRRAPLVGAVSLPAPDSDSSSSPAGARRRVARGHGPACPGTRGRLYLRRLHPCPSSKP